MFRLVWVPEVLRGYLQPAVNRQPGYRWGGLLEQACLFVRLLEANHHFLYMQEKQVVHRDLLPAIGAAPNALI